MPLKTKLMLALFIVLAILLALWIGRWAYVTHTIEQPQYSVIGKEGNIEIRRYAPVILARTKTDANNEWQAANNGFMTVAGYIFGGNQVRRQVSSHAKATDDRSGDKLQVTENNELKDQPTLKLRSTSKREKIKNYLIKKKIDFLTDILADEGVINKSEFEEKLE